MKLLSSETNLVGRWEFKDGKMLKDEVAKRIEFLIDKDLKKIKSDTSGWDILYLDENDGRYWELTYPESEMQGGGPQILTVMSENEAKAKYGLI
ncbi:MAG: hypothetical protein HYU71_15875 [Bacteroidetes bacterium]|nr:hypothetical protein [Bacteroidota bacterium]